MNLSYYHRPLAFTMLWAVISASHALMRPLCAAKINAVLSLLNVLVHLTVLHCFKAARYGMILAVSMIHWCGICNCVVDDQSSVTGYCSCKNILSANQTLWRWFLNKNSSQLMKMCSLDSVNIFLTLSTVCITDNDCHKVTATVAFGLSSNLFFNAFLKDLSICFNACSIKFSLHS